MAWHGTSLTIIFLLPTNTITHHHSLLVLRYFPLSAAMEALQDLTLQLFGINLHVAPLGAQEDWAPSSSHSSSPLGGVFNSQGQGQGQQQTMATLSNRPFKLLATARDGSPLGSVLIDLFQRPDKFTGAAHFTVRCGCSVLDDTHYRQLRQSSSSPTSSSSSSSSSPLSYEGLSERASRQLPLVALVFNFPPPKSSGLLSLAMAGEEEALLGLNDLTTLFHEWGHALHSLLSRTTYVSCSNFLFFFAVPLCSLLSIYCCLLAFSDTT
jgi:Zn-dependent oligopeptidase